MIPIIEEEVVNKHHWVSKETFSTSSPLHRAVGSVRRQYRHVHRLSSARLKGSAVHDAWCRVAVVPHHPHHRHGAQAVYVHSLDRRHVPGHPAGGRGAHRGAYVQPRQEREDRSSQRLDSRSLCRSHLCLRSQSHLGDYRRQGGRVPLWPTNRSCIASNL